MNSVQEGKHFSITDPQGIKTVIYQVYKTKKEQGKLQILSVMRLKMGAGIS